MYESNGKKETTTKNRGATNTRGPYSNSTLCHCLCTVLTAIKRLAMNASLFIYSNPSASPARHKCVVVLAL